MHRVPVMRAGVSILAGAMLMTFAFAAHAQDASAPPKEAHMGAMSDSMRSHMRDEAMQQLKMMADSLHLTADQRAKVKPIVQGQVDQLKQLRAKYAAMDKTPENRDAMRKEAMAIRESGDAKLATILTPDQMTQLKAMREAMMNKMKARMGAMGAEGGGK